MKRSRLIVISLPFFTIIGVWIFSHFARTYFEAEASVIGVGARIEPGFLEIAGYTGMPDSDRIRSKSNFEYYPPESRKMRSPVSTLTGKVMEPDYTYPTAEVWKDYGYGFSFETSFLHLIIALMVLTTAALGIRKGLKSLPKPPSS